MILATDGISQGTLITILVVLAILAVAVWLFRGRRG